MSRELIQELRDALRVVRVDAVSIGAGENAISDAARAKVDAALAKADAALAQPSAQPGYIASYEDVSAEFAASKFASPVHRLDAMIDTIVELRGALSAPARVSRWQPIETAPKDGTNFLGYRRGVVATSYCVPRDDCEMWVFGNEGGSFECWPEVRPTHWMPLPPPPGIAEQKEQQTALADPPSYTHAEVRAMLDSIAADAKRFGLEVVDHLDGKLGLQQAAPGQPPALAEEAARDVLAERRRQVEAEGWAPAAIRAEDHELWPTIVTHPTQKAAEPVAWMLCRHDGFVRGVYTEEPNDENLWAAEVNDEYYRPLYAAPVEQAAQPFQQCMDKWLLACFGEAIARDKAERNHRFLEEAIELVQACGCTASEAHQLVDYTFGRPAGDARQEVGGVMTTLAALCLAQGFDMQQAAEDELARIWTKVEQIRAKQAAKPKHSPLPEAVQSTDEWRDAYWNLRRYVEGKGIDTTCYGPAASRGAA